MFIYEIEKPGASVKGDDQKWCWKISSLLSNLESAFYEANISLNLFIDEYNKPSVIDEERMEYERIRKMQLMTEMGMIEPSMFNIDADPMEEHEKELRRYDEISNIISRERWESGVEPESFAGIKMRMHAKSFVFALDNFHKSLEVLANEQGTPDGLSDLRNMMSEVFPNLIGIRNTNHHMEARSIGLGAGIRPKKMNLKPINNGAIVCEGGGILVLNSFNNTKFGTVMADGSYGEIDVSPASMEQLQVIFTSVLGLFSWTGSRQLLPR